MLYLISKHYAGIDEIKAILIRAKTEQEAREIVSKQLWDGGDQWFDPKVVKVEIIHENGPSGEIICDFNNG